MKVGFKCMQMLQPSLHIAADPSLMDNGQSPLAGLT